VLSVVLGDILWLVSIGFESIGVMGFFWSFEVGFF
jgi:hypothetical protein